MLRTPLSSPGGPSTTRSIETTPKATERNNNGRVFYETTNTPRLSFGPKRSDGKAVLPTPPRGGGSRIVGDSDDEDVPAKKRRRVEHNDSTRIRGVLRDVFHADDDELQDALAARNEDVDDSSDIDDPSHRIVLGRTATVPSARRAMMMARPRFMNSEVRRYGRPTCLGLVKYFLIITRLTSLSPFISSQDRRTESYPQFSGFQLPNRSLPIPYTRP